MPCPTCGHTVAMLCTTGTVLKSDYYHCPRCGTVVVETPDGREEVYVPKLVERCQQLRDHMNAPADEPWRRIWHTLGIAESINLPENRTATPAQERTP